MIPNETIEEIKSKTSIVEVVSEYVHLDKKGRNYFGLCPFHDDTKPSMSVNDDKKIYKCFVCGNTGNVFNFLVNYKNISFVDSVILVAEKIGYNLNISKSVKKIDKNQKFYDMYDLLTKFYINNLYSTEGVSAKKYLSDRNITDDIIKTFKIGLSTKSYDMGTKLLLSNDYNVDDLINVGITNKNDYGYNDLFMNRIMFPLFSLDGKVIGYSGRIYNNEDSAKYINTKETVIFKKGMCLYNYHNAKNAVLKDKSIIIMEGFMDVIRAYSIGVTNVVATMGTAFTDEQAKLIKKLSDNVILCYDGDKAGVDAAFKTGNILIKMGINPKVVSLEKKLDPDDYILKYGKDIFLKKINNPDTFLEFKMNYYKKDKDLDNPEDLAKYIKEINEELNTIEDNVLKSLMIDKITCDLKLDKTLFDIKGNDTVVTSNIVVDDYYIDPNYLIEIPLDNMNEVSSSNSYNNEYIDFKDNNKYNGNNKKRPFKKSEPPKKSHVDVVDKRNIPVKYDKASKYILYYMMLHTEVVKAYEKSIAYLSCENYRFLAHEIVYFYKNNGKIEPVKFVNSIKDDSLIKVINEIKASDLTLQYSKKELEDCVTMLKEYSRDIKIKYLMSEIKEEKDKFRQKELLDEIIKIRNEI